MAGLKNGRHDTTSKGWQSVENLERCLVKQQILGKNAYQRFLKGTNLKMSGIWMRVDAFGKPSLVKGLPRREKPAMVGNQARCG